MATIDSASTATAVNIANITSNQWGAQSFTTPNDGKSYTLTVVTMSLQREVNNTAGNYVCKLYAHSGTYGTSSVPTGAALATSASRPYSDIATGSYANYDFTFSDSYVMSPNTNYCFSIETTDANGDGLRQGGAAAAAGAHAGNASYYNPSTWTAQAYDATPFTVTGTEAVAGGGAKPPTLLLMGVG